MFQALDVAIEFFAKAWCIVALRKTDGAGGLAHEVVLLDQPPIVEVPPF